MNIYFNLGHIGRIFLNTGGGEVKERERGIILEPCLNVDLMYTLNIPTSNAASVGLEVSIQGDLQTGHNLILNIKG